MWHGDGNWANLLWWLRAIRNGLAHLMLDRAWGKQKRTRSRPGGLWIFLSSVSFLIFVAIPLSGLTMEITTVSVTSQTIAPIAGPNPQSFNFKGGIGLPDVIRGSWRAGGPVTPSDASIFYAPNGTANVSLTYFNDEIHQAEPVDSIQVFLGPAVSQAVAGDAWGLEAKVSCQQVPRHSLQLIQVRGYNEYSIPFTDQTLCYDETAIFWNRTAYSLVVAADGSFYGSTPYDSHINYDGNTLEALQNRSSLTQPSTAIFEAYLWQGFHPDLQKDSAMQELLQDQSGLVDRDEATFEMGFVNKTFQMAGFAIKCSLITAVGNATLSAAHRTYASFETGTVATGTGTDQEVYPPQIQAVEALGIWDAFSYKMSVRDGTKYDSSWFAVHLATGSQPRLNVTGQVDTYTTNQNNYPAITPMNMTLAIYKLFGCSMIQMMAASGQEPWHGGLYLLESARYITPSVIPWRPVFILFAIWTAATVTVSLWLAFTKRWAPTLGSFEFFQLGAQYTDKVSDFTEESFTECSSLRNIPGMVGGLPGDQSGGTEGFIGLSESEASFDGSYVYDRKLAAVHRI
jgi:hypothetical protein